MEKERLQKVLAAAGIDSRRKCEELILMGAVTVNRRVVEKLPAFVDPENDIISVNGRRLQPPRTVYYLLNKPKGVICTNSDPQGRKRAIDIVKSDERIFCVGRLDIDTSGLIILTNDNELTNRLTHPKYELAKTYVALVKGHVTGEQVEKLKKGVWLAEGKTGKSALKILYRSHGESALEITITQGLNRQIRRMLAKVGLLVKTLKGTRIGKLNDKELGIGKFRPLTKLEVQYLKKVTSTERKQEKIIAKNNRPTA
ncbi:MAG: rRNA pseudouridine synthase [Candidatus Brocadiia bacterium]|nr:MAG: rRNA pseudouridine synthase [Candidatus Brocadiia bacterium]